MPDSPGGAERMFARPEPPRFRGLPSASASGEPKLDLVRLGQLDPDALVRGQAVEKLDDQLFGAVGGSSSNGQEPAAPLLRRASGPATITSLMG